MSLKDFFGILSIIPAVSAYSYYFRDIFANKTKPHAFSWLIWGTLAANGFIAQIGANAGVGAWATGLTSLVSLSIFVLALFKGDTNPTKFDWILLCMAMFGFVSLFIISNRYLAIWITLFALIAGFVMTIKKAYRKPEQETALAFALNTIKFIPSIFALSSFTFLTVAYPVVAALGNATIAFIIIFVTKRKLKPHSA